VAAEREEMTAIITMGNYITQGAKPSPRPGSDRRGAGRGGSDFVGDESEPPHSHTSSKRWASDRSQVSSR